jgi:hypothetical protein
LCEVGIESDFVVAQLPVLKDDRLIELVQVVFRVACSASPQLADLRKKPYGFRPIKTSPLVPFTRVVDVLTLPNGYRYLRCRRSAPPECHSTLRTSF